MHDLARVTKKPPHLFLRPLFRPHDAPIPFPRGSCHVTESDLNSPWEGPRSGFLLYSRFIRVPGRVPVVLPLPWHFIHAVHPVRVPLAFVHAVHPVRAPPTEGQGDPP